jgi:uncharacterized protein (DUF1499 family)
MPESPLLPPCPNAPNCVSSQANPADRVHHIPPLPLPAGMSVADAMASVVAELERWPRVRMLERSDTGLHATQTTRVFRFVDDLHVQVDAGARLVHVRSASRLGYGDMGVNRKRVTHLLQALATAWGVAWTGKPTPNR